MRFSKICFGKKIVLGAISFSLCAGSTGCIDGKSKETVSKAAENIEALKEVNLSAEKKLPVEIEFWYGLEGKLQEDMEKMVEEFNSSQKDIVVKYKKQDNCEQTMKKLGEAFTKEYVPTVVLLNAEHADGVARSGMAESLQPFIDADTDFYIDDLLDCFRAQGTYHNELMTMPVIGTTRVVYYNKALFEKNGLTDKDLATWQGFVEVAKKVGEYPVLEISEGHQVMMDAAFSSGGTVLSGSGKKVLVNDAKWVEVWDQFRKWIHDDKLIIIKSREQDAELKMIKDVLEGKVLSCIAAWGGVQNLDFDELGIAPQPGWEDKKTKAEATSKMLLIPKGGRSERENIAAYQFIKFITNTKNTAYFASDTGYLAVRRSAMEDENFKAYIEKNIQLKFPQIQADTLSSRAFIDRTEGRIIGALETAAHKVQIENIEASTALGEAYKKVQPVVRTLTR